MYSSSLDFWYKRNENKTTLTSTDYKNQLKEMLSTTSQTVDDLYCSLKNELENEILGTKQEREKIDQETKEIYKILSYKICENLIKLKLPWKVRFFNKVTCHGVGIYSSGRIMICYSLNNHIDNCFECILSVKEIKELIK